MLEEEYKIMKRGFIRMVFGSIDNSKLKMEIPKILKNPFNTDYITYVWGDDNYKRLCEMGLKCKLIDSNPFPYDMTKYTFRSKLDTYRIAMEDEGYDEIVYLDWDCVPTKTLPVDFWERLGQKESIQGNLYTLKQGMCHWRTDGVRSKMSACFLYIRDKTIPSKLIKIWNDFPDVRQWRFCDELVISKYIDDVNGGWIGYDQWWDRYETIFCHLQKKAAYGADKIKTKDICFFHEW
jgi:hypothetical protein